MQLMQDRRGFLRSMSLAGAAGICSVPRSILADTPGSTEPPPETETIRFCKIPAICFAPQYVARELLYEEGFTDVRYVPTGDSSRGELVANGDLDFCLEAMQSTLPLMDSGKPLVVLAGVHVGCYELFANDSIQAITDLRGKSVGVPAIGSPPHMFLSTVAAYIGLDPVTDINWVVGPSFGTIEAFVQGTIDATLASPPEPLELRAQNIGHVILRTVVDEPWSQYFCCMLTTNTDFMRNYPVATKRVVRAIMRAADLCAEQPEWAAQRMVDAGFADRYDYAVETLTNGVRYDVWREYNPEDTVRFYALRLYEVGMIASTPNEIIAGFTDWRFLNEVKSELNI